MKIQDPTIRKAIKDTMDEMSASYSRAEGETSFQREAMKNLAEKYDLDKKILTKMARVYHKSNFHTTVSDNDEFEAMYQDIMGVQE